jgi:membrane protease YdiL (CAAX protease family)
LTNSPLVLLVVRLINQYLAAHLTFWLPVWATQEALITGLASSSPTQRSIFFGLAVPLSGFVAPFVEELYNRGFLLPRMEHWGWVAPVLNSLLFALQHFYFPESVPGVFVAFIPISYVVMVKKDWRIGFIVHSLINLWGLFSVSQLITCGGLVMVGGAVTHPAATPEPDVRLSPHPALQYMGLCHRHHLPCTRSWQ